METVHRIRRGRICALALCLGIAAYGGNAVADDYPAQPITVIVPGTPGITGDVLARLLSVKISESWKTPVVVENKAGAGGILGTQFVAEAAPDGYTFLVANTSYSTLAALNKLPPAVTSHLVPVSLLGTSAMTLVTTNSFPAHNVKELIAEVKKQPGVYNYASPGIGSVQSMAMEWFTQESGIRLTHVPYKGTSGGLSDLIAGHVQMGVVSLPSAAAAIKAGKLRILAVLGKQRSPQFPEVPTMIESGFPDLVVETWNGIMAPAGTPAPVIAKLSAAVDEALKLPDVRQAAHSAGVDPAGGKPEVLESRVSKELDTWRLVIKRGNIVAD